MNESNPLAVGAIAVQDIWGRVKGRVEVRVRVKVKVKCKGWGWGWGWGGV
jgi:hypothetical protein